MKSCAHRTRLRRIIVMGVARYPSLEFELVGGSVDPGDEVLLWRRRLYIGVHQNGGLGAPPLEPRGRRRGVRLGVWLELCRALFVSARERLLRQRWLPFLPTAVSVHLLGFCVIREVICVIRVAHDMMCVRAIVFKSQSNRGSHHDLNADVCLP